MRTLLAAAILGAILPLAPGESVKAQEAPQRSLVVVVVMEHVVQGPYQSGYYGVSRGTGFFIAPDGTAITSSHVVYRVRANPITYQLLAIVGREFHGATLLCASDLPYDPIKQSTSIPPSRDVAEIQLTPSTFPF